MGHNLSTKVEDKTLLNTMVTGFFEITLLETEKKNDEKSQFSVSKWHALYRIFQDKILDEHSKSLSSPDFSPISPTIGIPNFKAKLDVKAILTP